MSSTPSIRDEVAKWTPAFAFAHLTETFNSACRLWPDLMERYATRLADAADGVERTEIMRGGLRETLAQRWPLHGEHQENAREAG